MVGTFRKGLMMAEEPLHCFTCDILPTVNLSYNVGELSHAGCHF